jgi:hypothetical protein
LTKPKPWRIASTTAPVATALRNTLSMIQLRNCIWPTIIPGSNTRDFSSAKPNTVPISTPLRILTATDDMIIPPKLKFDAAEAAR